MFFIYLLAGLCLTYTVIQFYIRKKLVEGHQDGSYATNPGGLRPRRSWLRAISPGLYPFRLAWDLQQFAYEGRIFVARQFWLGACNPAVVVHENPTIIAAYAADCDAVVLVRFMPSTIEAAKARGIGLRVGTRLLTVNTYFSSSFEFKNLDVVPGPRHSGRWINFRPYIAEFMCDDIDTIERRKREISVDLWERTKQMGLAKVKDADLDAVRWGHPTFVYEPRSYLRIVANAKAANIPY